MLLLSYRWSFSYFQEFVLCHNTRSDEIGGKNGLEPMLLASRNEFDRPVIDGEPS